MRWRKRKMRGKPLTRNTWRTEGAQLTFLSIYIRTKGLGFILYFWRFCVVFLLVFVFSVFLSWVIWWFQHVYSSHFQLSSGFCWLSYAFCHAFQVKSHQFCTQENRFQSIPELIGSFLILSWREKELFQMCEHYFLFIQCFTSHLL